MSKYSDKLFTIDFKNATLEINKPEVREIKAFRDILERDKGGRIKGDHDGRKKLFAKRELLYVYVMGDPFNMYAVLNDKRRHNQALETSFLKEFPEWKPDKVVKEAIRQYSEGVELSPIGHAFINARTALYNIGQDIDLFNSMNEELRENIEHCKQLLSDPEVVEQEAQEIKVKFREYVKELNKNNKEILEITSTLPDRLDSLEKLKLKLSEEDNEKQNIIGGGMVYNREEA